MICNNNNYENVDNVMVLTFDNEMPMVCCIIQPRNDAPANIENLSSDIYYFS